MKYVCVFISKLSTFLFYSNFPKSSESWKRFLHRMARTGIHCALNFERWYCSRFDTFCHRWRRRQFIILQTNLINFYVPFLKKEKLPTLEPRKHNCKVGNLTVLSFGKENIEKNYPVLWTRNLLYSVRWSW